ncbi:response regulator transcription factor [Bradyrhizobium elkanii]|uniref:response regulator transcription factor n=1 Tax=Bradyrhizobium elkanii TaxID=29448 RepID=UPI002168546D|nr:response regulator [Bradyrhizobium elkanii]MCS3522200.1 FixJ family two-component response regulator [Bradyrhizobium elkanii]MCS4069854.1 FixJ family two-component response regulator [Bradyrhizobium elkanii]MCS4076485.1 FixJ family two-component response regulator [Bradyrhizobium elkanii]MCW2124957.1 FixJ family two-component response regulator [Bradyrhizobium elkanii]MCW2171703.1 FixJ family two-component response regulator [Bradyrhizobium elkanii]
MPPSPPTISSVAALDKSAAVVVVDDDEGVRTALANLFHSVGLDVQLFASAVELLRGKLPDVPSCLVLDIRLPGLSGLDLQTDLANAGIHIPIIFITAHADIPMSVRAMRGGAVDFLSKPFREQDMLDAVTRGIDRDRTRRDDERAVSAARAAHEGLTNREQEIMALVATGLLNKEIGAKLGIAEITVKIHRGRVMKKMGAQSLAELIRMTDMLGIASSLPGLRS